MESHEEQIDRLKAAIRAHRDQRDDDRCWEDDLRLYAALGEGDVGPEAMALPPKCDFLKSCERYYDQRQVPLSAGTAELPGRMTIAQMTAALEKAQDVCRMVVKFWGSEEAWGDYASLTRAAGAFAPVADAAREALGIE